MKPEQLIVTLFVTTILAFSAGVYVERGSPPQQSPFPSNYDPVGVATEARMAREEAKAYLELLNKQTVAFSELKAVCSAKNVP